MTASVDLDAILYRNNSSSQASQAAQLLKKLSIKEDSSILDVGCGCGDITANLSTLAKKGRVVGVDPSQSMIQLAADTYSEQIYSNLEFNEIKAEDIGFDNEFDLVMCFNALMWVRNPQLALNLMCKSLKKGGNLVIFTYCKDTPFVEVFEETLLEYFPEIITLSAVNTMLSFREHRNVLSSFGMDINLLKKEKLAFHYKNRHDFTNYVMGWLACYAPIPKNRQIFFINKVIEKLKLFNFSQGGEINLPHATISIMATKN